MCEHFSSASSDRITDKQDAVQLLKDGIDLITDSDKALSNLLSYPLSATLASDEFKSAIKDTISEVAAGLLSSFDSGELQNALEEGAPGWQKWVKSFGKSVKRKGKSLFMPLRVLLTGKLHGPEMSSSVLLLYKAGISDVVAPHSEFVTLEERFKMLREVDWDSIDKDRPVLESAASASH